MFVGMHRFFLTPLLLQAIQMKDKKTVHLVTHLAHLFIVRALEKLNPFLSSLLLVAFFDNFSDFFQILEHLQKWEQKLHGILKMEL